MVLPAPPLPPLLSVPPRHWAHADNPTASASMPATNTLWCCCFMIDSF